MALDHGYILAFMLLHEVGHIAHGHAAAEFSKGALSQLNIDPSLAKAREEEADEFASVLIRDLSRSSPATNTSMTANLVAMELLKISWNMQAYRTLDEFAASATGKPSVFFDRSYSHPNLAWRILRSNYKIQESEQAKDLLDAFETARQKGVNPAILYPRNSEDEFFISD
jgi:hypothetical protein